MSRRAARNRLTIVRAAVLTAALLLVARLVQIQVLRHTTYAACAASQWTHPHEILPDRGELYDRYGRPLALSVRVWRVGVSTSLLESGDVDSVVARLAEVPGCEAESIAQRLARANGDHIVVARRAVLAPTVVQRLNEYSAITTERLRRRVYPFDGVGAALIGFHSRKADGSGMAEGLESGLDPLLVGRRGRALEIATAHPTRSMGDVVLEPARNGCDLDLTLDMELQRICESELAGAVNRCGAQGGSVLIIAPGSGDVLAAASAPLLSRRDASTADPAAWRNRNFSEAFEPGSVFKVFTAAALLSAGAADTATVFDCSTGDFGTFRLRESEGHTFGSLSLTGALVHSSNIWFGRAAGNLGAWEFYRKLAEFGFGHGTNLAYPAEAIGILHQPRQWSGRSKATIAIGQEVAVTPLQLGLAVAAVTNGGWLYAPRIVRRIHKRDTPPGREIPPVPLRRVVEPQVAGMLRDLMARVVSEGTGQAAYNPLLPAGGKTGTAQKSRDGRGYTAGCYVATFAGFVPVAQPRLVIVAVLDEPDARHHYAAQSAVPLFAAVVREVARRTSWLDGVADIAGGAADRAGSDGIAVPDVLHVSAERAVRCLETAGLQVGSAGRNGIVVEQVPVAGSRCARGSQVYLTLAAPGQPAAGVPCPDVTGLSDRQIRGLAARLGVELVMNGSGYVVDQVPAAGSQLTAGGLRVRMAW